MGETWKKKKSEKKKEERQTDREREVNPCAFKRDKQLIYIHMCHKIETSRRKKARQT